MYEETRMTEKISFCCS